MLNSTQRKVERKNPRFCFKKLRVLVVNKTPFKVLLPFSSWDEINEDSKNGFQRIVSESVIVSD